MTAETQAAINELTDLQSSTSQLATVLYILQGSSPIGAVLVGIDAQLVTIACQIQTIINELSTVYYQLLNGFQGVTGPQAAAELTLTVKSVQALEVSIAAVISSIQALSTQVVQPSTQITALDVAALQGPTGSVNAELSDVVSTLQATLATLATVNDVPVNPAIPQVTAFLTALKTQIIVFQGQIQAFLAVFCKYSSGGSLQAFVLDLKP